MATTSNLAPGQAWTGMDRFAGSTAADRIRNLALARRHTRLVQFLRWTLPAAAAGVLATYFAMIFSTTGWIGSFPTLDIPRIVPDNLTMDNPSYEGFNKDGGKYVVRAKTAVQDLVNTEFVRLSHITGDLIDVNKSKTKLTALRGEFNTKANKLDLSGGIDIAAESGLKAKLTSATIMTQENLIFSKEPVVVEMPSGTVNSNEMRILNKSREIAFIDDVRAHLIPPKKDETAAAAEAAKPAAAPLLGGGDGPIDVTANRLDIDDTGKTATFTGNVHATQAGAGLETQSLEVRYEGGQTGSGSNGLTGSAPGAGTKIQRIVSKSPVVMTRAPQDRVTGRSLDYDAVNQVAVVSGDVTMASGPDRRATADKVRVDQRADTILLTGSVVAVQGRNQLKGERLFVERASGRTQLTSPEGMGDSNGRISTRFYRGEENTALTAEEKVKQLAKAGAQAAASGATAMFKTDPTAPIDVESDRLDVDDRIKQAVFKGAVRAVQGDFIVRTSEMRAFYNGNAGLAEQTESTEKKPPAQITRIEARGEVIVTSAKTGQTATGDWADYDVKNNQVLLGGNVVLTQGKNVVNGTKLTIDMLTGESVIDSDRGAAWSATAAPSGTPGKQGFTVQPGSQKRPSAIFYPREKKAAEKKSPANDSGSGSGAGWNPDGSAP